MGDGERGGPCLYHGAAQPVRWCALHRQRHRAVIRSVTRPRRLPMSQTTSLETDRAHLMHPLHHPSSYKSARVWVSGEGAIIKDATGREYLDGLSGLWN